MVWTAEESKQVAIETARLLNAQGIHMVPTTGDRTGRQMLHEITTTAQIVLPRNRRRLRAPLHAYNPLFWKFVNDSVTTKSYLKIAQPKPEENQQQPPAKTEAKTESVAQTSSPPAEPPVAPPAGYAIVNADHPLGNVPTTALFNEIARRLETWDHQMRELKGLSDLLIEESQRAEYRHQDMLQRMARIEPAMKIAPVVEKPLPKVAIIGCRRDEFEHIAQKCRTTGIRCDLRLYEQNTKPTRIHAEWAIRLKWAGHEWADQVRVSIPRGQYVFMDGGTGMAVAQLKAWFNPSGA